MSHATLYGMHFGAAQGLRIDGLAHCTLHQVWSAESHKTHFIHHDDDVAQCRQVCTARDARTHDGGDLRDAQPAAHQ